VSLGARSLAVFSEPWTGLPAAARAWLLVLALGNERLATCSRAAESLGLQLDDLAPAEATGIVRVTSTNKITWASPFTRVAVAQSAATADIVKTYRALAVTSSAKSEPVEHAHWLAHSLSDLDAETSTLRTAIAAMAKEGRLLEAYELAGYVSERVSDPSQSRQYRVIAAELCWLAGYGEHALRLVDQLAAVPDKDSGSSSEMVLRQVVKGYRTAWDLAPELPVETADSSQLARSLGTALLAGWETATPQALAGVLIRLRELDGRPGEHPAGAGHALTRVVTGHSDLSQVERASLHAVAWWVHSDDAVHPKAWPPPLLPVFLGEEGDYAERFIARLDTAHVRSARSTRALLLLKLATAQAALGHWEHAERHASTAAALADEVGLRALCTDALVLSAWIAAYRGDASDCRGMLETAYRQEGRRGAGGHPPMVQWVLGLLAISSAQPVEAYQWLRPLHTGAAGSPNELVIKRLSTADFIEAAVHAREPEEAARSVAEFREWVADGAAPWAHLDLARCLAALGETDAEQWYSLALERAVTVGRLPVAARTELSFGSWLRRQKRDRDARPHLRLAAQYFERLGAGVWQRRARAELRAAGETDAASVAVQETLTAQELQVAQLAARGMTNKQIADVLSLSPRTISYHLYKVFPKLDVTSRTQLPRAIDGLQRTDP
jgi:DNA-binding CsgD family transcriptional regulator